VYHRQHKAKSAAVSNVSSKSSTQANGAATNTKTSAPADPYAGWKTYTSGAAGYSIKYPSSWSIRTASTSGSESTIISSPDDFEVKLQSFAKDSAEGVNNFTANPSGQCGATCLNGDKIATFNVAKLGELELDAQTQGAGGGSINTLVLTTPSGSFYVASPSETNAFTTVGGVYQGQPQQQSTNQTLTQFTSSASVQAAELIYKSLSY
jgi:hypothetical protein